jgi:uncharacterized OB-fold protein
VSAGESYLAAGLPRPVPDGMGLDKPYWEATLEHRLAVQQCQSCHRSQWGPEWYCWRCGSAELGWADVEGTATIYSWERVWHPVHPALVESVPYLVVLVELPQADNVRMVGNLLGDPRQDVPIGGPAHAVFEDHDGYTLVQWALD